MPLIFVRGGELPDIRDTICELESRRPGQSNIEKHKKRSTGLTSYQKKEKKGVKPVKRLGHGIIPGGSNINKENAA